MEKCKTLRSWASSG